MKIKTQLLFICMLVLFSQSMNAQKEETKQGRKMTIITKTVDEKGKETVTTTVKEGDEVSDEEIDKLLKEFSDGEVTLDVEVDAEKEGSEEIIITEKSGTGAEKKYRIIKKSQEVEVESNEDGEVKVIVMDGDEGEAEHKVKIIKKDKGEEIIIKGDGDGNGEKMIFISEDGDVQKVEKEIKIIKKKAGEDDEMEIEVITEDGNENIWIEKAGGEDGEIIIIEEETTEEIDKDGKTIKKTVKKTKKIKKEKH